MMSIYAYCVVDIYLITITLSYNNEKREMKKPNRNKLGMETTFRDSLCRSANAQKATFCISLRPVNLPYMDSLDIKFKCVLYLNLRMSAFRNYLRPKM